MNINNIKKNIVNSDIPNNIKKYSTNNTVTLNNELNDEKQIDKKLLAENIKLLSKQECYIIFNLITQDTDKWTENNNGIFINSNNIKFETLRNINEYVNKIIKNKKKYLNKSIIVETEHIYNNNESNQLLKLSNYEKSIVKRNNYINEQQKFKNNNWFIKKEI